MKQINHNKFPPKNKISINSPRTKKGVLWSYQQKLTRKEHKFPPTNFFKPLITNNL